MNSRRASVSPITLKQVLPAILDENVAIVSEQDPCAENGFSSQKTHAVGHCGGGTDMDPAAIDPIADWEVAAIHLRNCGLDESGAPSTLLVIEIEDPDA